MADLQQTVYPHIKWSPVSFRSRAGKGKFTCYKAALRVSVEIVCLAPDQLQNILINNWTTLTAIGTIGGTHDITADVRDRLHWLALQQRVEYKVSLLVYKCLHQAAPSYLAEMCVPVSATDNRCHLRSTTHLAVPRVKLARYGRRGFSVSGPLMWNSLPLTVRDVSLTLTQFCARLKTFLFSIAYGT